MVEFGLALPILLLVMYGLIESGRLLFLYASVVTAARQAVRYGSVTGVNAGGTPYYNDCAGIRATAKGFGFIQPFRDADITIQYDNGPERQGTPQYWFDGDCPISTLAHPVNGDRIYVRVSTQYSPIVPLVPFRPFTIASAGWRTLLVEVSIPVPVPPVILTPGTGSAMSLLKDAWCSGCNPPGVYYERVGNIITYTYSIHNLGSEPISGITVTDDQITRQGGSVNCSGLPDPLLSGVTAQCTASYTIEQGDIDTGTVTNTGTATGVSNSLPIVAQASKTIHFSPKPSLMLAKTGSVRKYATSGSPVDYTFTLTNTGNVALISPYTINDPNLDTVDCSAAVSPLAINASTNCTGVHYLTKNDINGGVVNNTATATAMYGSYTVTSNAASASVPVPGLILVVNTCTTSPCANPSTATISTLGQTIYYAYTVTNRTTTTKWFIVISDTRVGTNMSCITMLAPLASGTCTKPYTGYTQADMDSPTGQITSQAVAQGSLAKPSNTVTTIVTVLQNKSVLLSKQPSVQQATVINTPITYTYSLTNNGNVTLSSPYGISDNLIKTFDCTGAPSTLAPNSSGIVCTAIYTVGQTDLDAGSIVNTAYGYATFAGQQVFSPSASATVITYLGSRLGLIKAANPVTYGAQGQTITYTYTLKNTGGVNLIAPYTVTDNLVPGIDCSGALSPLLPSKTTTCSSGSYTISSADMLASTVTNNATATAVDSGTMLPITSIPAPSKATVTRFLCDNVHLTHLDPTPIPDGADVTWTIVNNTGLLVHINSITLYWSSGPPYLTGVLMNGPIWNGLSPASGGFTLPLPPAGSWPLPTGNTPMEIQFSGGATGIRVVLTFAESGCPRIDSSIPPPPPPTP